MTNAGQAEAAAGTEARGGTTMEEGMELQPRIVGEAPEAWLAGLKTGDAVVLEIGMPGSEKCPRYIVGVQSASKTLITVRNDNFRRRDGYQTATNTFGFSRLMQPTPALVAQVRAENRHRSNLATLKTAKWDQMPVEFVARLAALVREQTGEKQ